ncbi:MAG: cytochrome c biogenesis protein, partial [Gemmataceae bacterium]
GMIVHFGIKLQGFLKARAVSGRLLPAAKAEKDETKPVSATERFLPVGVAGLVGLYLVMVLSSLHSGQSKGVQEYGSLPVLHEGRVKPLDTFARVSLMTISNRQSLATDDGRHESAVKWLLDTSAGRGNEYPVFRIENIEVLDLLGLKNRSGFRYSYNEIQGKRTKIVQEYERLHKKEAKQRTTYEQKIVELGDHVALYEAIAKKGAPSVIPPETDGGNWSSYAQMMNAALGEVFHRAEILEREGKLKLDPSNPHHRDIMLQAAQDLLPPNTRAYHEVVAAYSADREEDFEKALDKYRATYTHVPAEATAKIGTEVFFNGFAPFYHCTILYVFAFLLVALSWLFDAPALNRAGFWLALCTLVIHSVGLLMRMYLMDRPFVFVTNLYSSAIFIGWFCLVLGLILEAIFRNGFGTVLAAVTGFLTTIVAHNLASGDTIEQLQAVLDTNFWLATHVTCITIGYAGTFFAGFAGIAYLMGRAVNLEEGRLKSLAQMTYGMLCFAVLFSFVGTVLGGIWADQSWGRFWGWDPKENGALIIVLWNALVLHARWGGQVKARGMCALAIVGNMVTAWSWFGTNQLGVGLHSYGFSNKLAFWLVVFWTTQVAALALAFVPAGAVKGNLLLERVRGK